MTAFKLGLWFSILKKEKKSLALLLCSMSIPAMQTGIELVFLWADTIYIRNHLLQC